MGTKKAIGIDIGGTNLRVALISENGEVLQRDQFPSDEQMITNLTGAIDRLNSEEVSGIGISVAGIIDRKTDTVSLSPNLPAVEGIPLASDLRDRYGVRVIIDNDANCATLGERYVGMGKDLDSFILMTLGTGIGGGVFIDGKILDIPAEIGHITIRSDDRQCTCGNHGCVEELAAAKGMKAMVISALEKGEQSTLRDCCDGNIYRITPKTLYEHAIEGDRLSRDVLRDAGRDLGVAIASLANMFNPQAFILTGGLTNAWNIYIEEAIKEADKRALRGLFSRDTVVLSSIKEDAGLIGAALHSIRTP